MNDQPTEKLYTVAEKDTILRDAFRRLKVRGFDSAWSKHPTPFTALHAECLELMADAAGNNPPILRAAREFLNDRLFRLLRNGFAHWGFDWEVVGRESYVIAYDWERDLPTAKLHEAEADAFHIIAFALVEVLDDVFIHRSMSPVARGSPCAATA